MFTPIDLQHWIEEHRHLLKPPINNKVVWEDGEFIVMVVGGPNQRTDFHFDEGAEFFYQLEGDMLLRIMHESASGNRPEDIPIREGEIFLLPPRVPHSPQRFGNTIGLVIERKRRADEKDGLMWYCQQCHHKLFARYFTLENIETQLPQVFARFNSEPELRECEQCGHHNPRA